MGEHLDEDLDILVICILGGTWTSKKRVSASVEGTGSSGLGRRDMIRQLPNRETGLFKEPTPFIRLIFHRTAFTLTYFPFSRLCYKETVRNAVAINRYGCCKIAGLRELFSCQGKVRVPIRRHSVSTMCQVASVRSLLRRLVSSYLSGVSVSRRNASFNHGLRGRREPRMLRMATCPSPPFPSNIGSLSLTRIIRLRGTAELESKIESLVNLLSAAQVVKLSHAEDTGVPSANEVNLSSGFSFGKSSNGFVGEEMTSQSHSMGTSLPGNAWAATTPPTTFSRLVLPRAVPELGAIWLTFQGITLPSRLHPRKTALPHLQRNHLTTYYRYSEFSSQYFSHMLSSHPM